MVTAIMDSSQPRLRLNPATLPWLHVLIIAALIISRRPAAILHPLFWAEDGKVFYHDAYSYGVASVWHPLGGYLNTLSRLVALFTAQLPLLWAPGIYAAFAFVIQLVPVALMLSRRMAAALPSWPTRLAMVYFYAALPNSYELNINLTNAQWHLAIVAFLLLVSTPPASRIARFGDAALLALAGLSGPFSVFLAPVAWWEIASTRTWAKIMNAINISATAVVQIIIILALHATQGRLPTPLGATPAAFVKIVTYQIVFGGLLGDRLTLLFLTLPIWHSLAALTVAMTAAAALVGFALWRGPPLYRKAAFWAASLFGAALITPLSSTSIPQWTEMTHPGASIRYYAIPTLIWFATILITARSPWLPTRSAAYIILLATLFGIRFSWTYPPFHSTNFTAEAKQFSLAPRGFTASFEENPPTWFMTLTKK